MQFSIIYSVGVPEGVDVLDLAPPDVDQLWDETEGDEQYEYSYLEGRGKADRTENTVQFLDLEEFDRFIDHCGLRAENVQTMGSIGAPGFGYGWAPAINFTSDDPDAILSAYVTPIPETRKECLDESD